MLIDMEKYKIISIWNGEYKPSERYCKQKDTVSRTIQDAIVDIPSLLKAFNGTLSDLFDKFNNGLLYESSIGVFVDELNSEELAKYNQFVAEKEKREADEKREAELFEQFKADVARKVAASRQESPSVPTGQNEETKS